VAAPVTSTADDRRHTSGRTQRHFARPFRTYTTSGDTTGRAGGNRVHEKLHFGCAQTRSPRRTWCLAARGPGQGPRTSRTTNTMSCGRGVPGHTRSKAPMCFAGEAASAIQTARQRPPRTVVHPGDRRRAFLRRPVGAENEKGPDPFGNRASADRAGRGAPRRFPLPDALSIPARQAGRSRFYQSIRDYSCVTCRLTTQCSRPRTRAHPAPTGVGGFV